MMSGVRGVGLGARLEARAQAFEDMVAMMMGLPDACMAICNRLYLVRLPTISQ